MDATLADAAFGTAPGTWPLPTATTPDQLWLRAVAAGGQGRYGSAYADLALLRRGVASGSLASLAHSTHGSFLRQLGWHTLARGWDGRALALAGRDPEARADALVGLAADALGVGRFAAAQTLLARADEAVHQAELPALTADRLAVRRGWVGAELAMASGDGRTAVERAEDALAQASTMTGRSARHRIKSSVVLAAALCAAGCVERARDVAEQALQAAEQLGLTPLRWALACLLMDTGRVTVGAQGLPELLEIRDICAGEVQRAGGVWRTA
ncbi:hypothetical protein [Mycobacterium vicinigordonae]|uniref:MalT-like TPR region domain-containing protein n=1 Tax=Mycobacterium vicinigordonae TaxID=1719132 RepID=A0A7D6E5A3_9MYCO|nr:hypothetical protein [Mycobacterium vicinigordonae]QLL10021.1 hypothetical protein H0P51_05635 [Mycobacterium vicinigordonae]